MTEPASKRSFTAADRVAAGNLRAIWNSKRRELGGNRGQRSMSRDRWPAGVARELASVAAAEILAQHEGEMWAALAVDVLEAFANGRDVAAVVDGRKPEPDATQRARAVAAVLSACYGGGTTSMNQAYEIAAEAMGLSDVNGAHEVRKLWRKHWKEQGVEFVPPWEFRKWSEREGE